MSTQETQIPDIVAELMKDRVALAKLATVSKRFNELSQYNKNACVSTEDLITQFKKLSTEHKCDISMTFPMNITFKTKSQFRFTKTITLNCNNREKKNKEPKFFIAFHITFDIPILTFSENPQNKVNYDEGVRTIAELKEMIQKEFKEVRLSASSSTVLMYVQDSDLIDAITKKYIDTNIDLNTVRIDVERESLDENEELDAALDEALKLKEPVIKELIYKYIKMWCVFAEKRGGQNNKSNDKSSVVYLNKQRKVHISKDNKKYIHVQNAKVMLSSIRGKYRYV